MSTETEQQLQDRQRAIEGDCLQEGIKQYRDNVDSRGISESVVGNRLMNDTLDTFSTVITTQVNKGLSGYGCKGSSHLKYISQFDPDQVAYITMKTVLEVMVKNKSLAHTALKISERLNSMLNYEKLRAENKPAFDQYNHKIKKFPTLGTDRLWVIVKRQMEWGKVEQIQWDRSTRLRLGIFLVELMRQTTGYLKLVTIKAGTKRSSCSLVTMTDALREHLKSAHGRCELQAPSRKPMICKPLDWSTPTNGGYLTSSQSYKFIKTSNHRYMKELANHSIPLVYNAVNKMQDTAWKVNKPVYTVLDKAWAQGGLIGGLPAADADTPPVKPSQNLSPEQLIKYKKEMTIYYKALNRNDSIRLQLSMKLSLAEQFKGEEQFYFPYTLDFRGRIYPIPNGLNPQGDDVSKALLTFARGKALGDNGAYWLAVHGANVYGEKGTFDQRVDWVEKFTDGILESTLNPLDCEFWQQADKPYQFLAFCFEWSRMLMASSRSEYISHLPVAFDGTCNGLQHFAAMLRDEGGSRAVGLLNNAEGTPPDVYTLVAEQVVGLMASDTDPMAEKWINYIDRKMVKQNAMTTPYGVGDNGKSNQVMTVLDGMREKLLADGVTYNYADSDYIAKMNHKAIATVVAASEGAMEWLKDVANVASSTGLPIKWTSPAGLPVLQFKQGTTADRPDWMMLGRRITVVMQYENGKVDKMKQRRGISPNFVHSLDAAALMLTVNYCSEVGVDSFAMIHDSYGTHAGCADQLQYELRRAFVDIYKQPVMQNFRDDVLSQLPEGTVLPEVPVMGDLKVDEILKSEYMFS